MTDEIYLRSFEKDDEEFLVKLRLNKNLFQYTCGNTYFMSKEHSKKMLNESFTNTNKIYVMICLCTKNIPVGYLSLTEIDHINKKICWGGIVIDPKYAGNGYATSASKLMLRFVFEEMNMNKIYGYWLEENYASLKMAEKIGFAKEGYLKEHVFKTNKYHNVCIYSILKKDYKR